MTKRILCISLTPIERDARVLRQIELLSSLGEVTTIGFGRQPKLSTRHIQVPDGLSTLPQTVLGVFKLAMRLHRAAECASPAAKYVLSQNIGDDWDLVVANDARVLDLARALAGDAPIWADMHEWAPEERTHILSWRLLVAPMMVHLCRKYLPNAALVTTVSKGIVELYRSEFGVDALLMTNAGQYREISPSAASTDKVRCVHSGAAIHGRGLERMVEAFLQLPDRFTLDLYLVQGGDGGAHLRELRELASQSGRVTFHEPVRPEELPKTLAPYDLGIFWIPPTHTNARLTLPNKFFDYVQARIGIAIGPSEEMVRELIEHDLGVVSDSFELPDLVNSIESVTPEKLQRWKDSAARAARPLSFESQTQEVLTALTQLLGAAE